MYSNDIQKLCKYCINAKAAVGVEGYMYCYIHLGYFAIRHSCPDFKYDIFKKELHRHPSVSSLGFTAEDFAID